MSLFDRIKELFGSGRSGAEAGNVAAFGAVAGSGDADGRDSSADSTDNSSGTFDFGGGSGDSGGAGS